MSLGSMAVSWIGQVSAWEIRDYSGGHHRDATNRVVVFPTPRFKAGCGKNSYSAELETAHIVPCEP